MSNRRTDPAPWSPSYLLLRSLAAQLRSQARTRLDGGGLALLDVGCGTRPYESIFAPYVERSVGVDVTPGPRVDVVSPAESLPFKDGSFDCVLCSQVLEHAEDPGAVVGEAHRVLRDRGVAFVSTHGIARYHPNPADYWRWTGAGLERLFASAGEWGSIDVYPNGGSGATIAYLAGQELSIAARTVGAAPVANAVTFVLNAVACRLDRLLLRTHPEHFADVAPNYLVVATR